MLGDASRRGAVVAPVLDARFPPLHLAGVVPESVVPIASQLP